MNSAAKTSAPISTALRSSVMGGVSAGPQSVTIRSLSTRWCLSSWAMLPDEPTIFSMAHELKHHLVDKDLMVTLCGQADTPPITDDRRAVEIGAEVFAAEFIYPEADFVRDFEKIGGPCNPRALVRLKEATSTTLSYQAMVKRSLRLGLLHYTDEFRVEVVHWGLLEKRLFGRRLSDARRQQRLAK